MADSEVLEGVLDPVVVSGDFIPEREDHPISKLQQVRRAERTKLPQTISTPGRLLNSRPKSPLLRMAEMRKGGLKGRVLRHSGRKGFEHSELNTLPGKKRLGGRRLQMLETISEGKEGSLEVVVHEFSGEEVVGGEMLVDSGIKGQGLQVLSSPDCKLDEEVNLRKEPIPAGTSADLALDLIETQPLHDMGFIGEQVVQVSGEKDCLMLEMETQQRDEFGNDRGDNAAMQEVVLKMISLC